MAESQVPFPYLQHDLAALRLSLSEPRFATYLKKGGNHEEYAMALYLYNSRLAKAFLYPLSVAEITLRNAVDPVLVSRHGPDWHQDANFLNQILSPDSRRSLDKAIQRAGFNAPRDQVVATLTFDFWSNLFRPEYASTWRTTVNIAFPNLPRGESRKEIQVLVKTINDFRNRVAHHEPVLDYNVTEIYSKIVRLVELRCTTTALWMKHFSTVGSVIRSRPKLNGATSNTLETRIDKEFIAVTEDSPLLEVVVKSDPRHPVMICVDAAARPQAAFTVNDVLQFISGCAAQAEGLVALQDYRVGDLLRAASFVSQWVVLDEQVAFGLAVRELLKPRVQILVAIETVTGKATGAILRAHRRY